MNLLKINDPTIVEKTSLTRKLTINGVTKPYPVYKIRLDHLFYNDQNDRIATWISQSNLDIDKDNPLYNETIERFIILSNEDAIEKTKNNIALVNQREPGVVLCDGRVIDGNRRFTCLRLLNKDTNNYQYFEGVILGEDISNDPKTIKKLELTIQHGEEQRVDYNLIDFAIGTYHDVVETRLLTVDEYAESSNESRTEVKKRIAVAELIVEFLEFINLPRQYHVARDMQIYSVFYEFLPVLKKCQNKEEEDSFKRSVFTNVMMNPKIDHRKYIRDVKSLFDSAHYFTYLKEQEAIANEVEEEFKKEKITNEKELSSFVKNHHDQSIELIDSLEEAVVSGKRKKAKSKPAELVEKGLDNITDIDIGVIDKLDEDEKSRLANTIKKMEKAVGVIKGELGENVPQKEEKPKKEVPSIAIEQKTIAPTLIDYSKPFPVCLNSDKPITGFITTLKMTAFPLNKKCDSDVKVSMVVIDENYNNLSKEKPCVLTINQEKLINIDLNQEIAKLKKCLLKISYYGKEDKEAICLIEFQIDISFSF